MRYSYVIQIILMIFGSGIFAQQSSAEVFKLTVPYTSQAPEGIWRQPWQDACEEASILMVDAYYRQHAPGTIKPATAKKLIQNIIALENKTLKHNKDTNAVETALIINNFFRWEAIEKIDPTLDDIRTELANGRPVIAPVYGKGLKNPGFRSGGPDYHMIVITGYDDEREEFITNEPGINRGLDFRYSYATIMDAIHDFVPGGKTSSGRRVVLFTSPVITRSENLSNQSLIKVIGVSSVYYYHDGTRQPILNEAVFNEHGWKFADVKNVSEELLNKLMEGEMIR